MENTFSVLYAPCRFNFVWFLARAVSVMLSNDQSKHIPLNNWWSCRALLVLLSWELLWLHVTVIMCCRFSDYWIWGTYRSWKVMEFKIQIFQAWKVMELGLGSGKSWKINQMVAAFLTRVLSVENVLVLHTQGNWFSTCIWKLDWFDIHLIRQSWKDMENGQKWSWKVLENAQKWVMENHGKPLSVFCMHPVNSVYGSVGSCL